MPLAGQSFEATPIPLNRSLTFEESGLFIRGGPLCLEAHVCADMPASYVFSIARAYAVIILAWHIYVFQAQIMTSKVDHRTERITEFIIAVDL